jgi:sterol 3beta-glucosyltransferase
VRILLLTAGSRGDVEPFVALARRARHAGHEVRLAVTRDALAVASGAGVDTVALDGDIQAVVAAQGVSVLAGMRSFRTVMMPMMSAIMRSAAEAALAYRPDVVVHHPKILSAPLAAARLGVPDVLVEIVPTMTPTREFAAAGVTSADLGPLNRLTYGLGAAANAAFRGPLREVRAQLGLPPKGALPGPARSAVPVSPALLARPADWPATTQITGQWYEPARENGDPDPELDEFLAGGDVVCAGFGSMAIAGSADRGRAVVEASRAAGLRALAVTGWGGLEVPSALVGRDVLVRRAVPHAEVLPRCVAAVHHGGSGTVHAVVRAGLPSVVVPFIADQPFWAGLLHRKGLAAPPVPARRLTADRLAAALAALPDADAVRPIADRMSTEDGCAAALRLLDEVTRP